MRNRPLSRSTVAGLAQIKEDTLDEIKTTYKEPQLITVEELAALKAQIKQLITAQANLLNKKRA